MTWAGEDSGSGLYMFTDDGSPRTIPLGSNGQILAMQGGIPEFLDAGVVQSGQHGFLSSTHLDTEPSSPTDGELVYASGNLWRKLLPGEESYVLTIESGYPSWQESGPPFGGDNEIGFGITDGINKFADSTESTTSTSYVTLTPTVSLVGSGDFVLIFSSTVTSSAANVTASIAAFVDGVLASGTTRDYTYASANADAILATNGLVAVPTSGSIEIRWKRTGGPPSTTLTAKSRSLTLVRIRNIIDA